MRVEDSLIDVMETMNQLLQIETYVRLKNSHNR